MSENTLDELNIELLRNKLYKVSVSQEIMIFLYYIIHLRQSSLLKVTFPIS